MTNSRNKGKVYEKNYCADLVTMEFTEWIKLYREWELNMKGE